MLTRSGLYINIKYLHLSEIIEQGMIRIHSVLTHDQIADALSKPLA